MKALLPIRRYKVLYLPEDFPLNMLLMEALNPGDCLIRHRFRLEDFPDGLEVHRVHWDYSHMSWAYLLWHPSFPIIPTDQIIPQIEIDKVKLDVFIISNETKIEKSFMNLPKMF